MADKKKSDREQQLEQDLGELTADLQRVQADFINYRARMEEDKQRATASAKAATVLKLLPVIDDIERAIAHVPDELADNAWARGVGALGKGLDKSLNELGVTRIAAAGRPFDPNLHEAISADGDGEHEVVGEELRAGYLLDGQVIRHSLVKVLRQSAPEAELPETAQEIIKGTKTAEPITPEAETRGEE